MERKQLIKELSQLSPEARDAYSLWTSMRFNHDPEGLADEAAERFQNLTGMSPERFSGWDDESNG